MRPSASAWARLIIGADVARAEVPCTDAIPYIIAYHEIIEALEQNPVYDPQRCDVVCDGAISPDFYGWVFPHGSTANSGKGIYYAMAGGSVAASVASACLVSEQTSDLKLACRLFLQEHKTVFRVLASMQNAYYRPNERRERFVPLCHDVDVQRLTFEVCVNRKLVKARPLAHVKVGLKNIAHLTGPVRAEYV